MNQHMNIKFAFLLLGLPIMNPIANATDWSLTYGMHDFIVSDESSHTFGTDVGITVETIAYSEIMLDGSFTAFINYNKDKLDPDYEPLWYKTHVQIKKEFYSLNSNIGLAWLVRFDGILNTVSAVEKQSKVFTGIGGHYTTSTLDVGLKTLVGYYFLEIDDDVPSRFGYGPSDLQNETAAYTLIAESNIPLNTKANAYVRVQRWMDTHQWLENQYQVMVSYDSTEWIQGSTLHTSAEHTQYNLNPYQKRGFAPILPWENDLLVRVYMKIPWGE